MTVAFGAPQGFATSSGNTESSSTVTRLPESSVGGRRTSPFRPDTTSSRWRSIGSESAIDISGDGDDVVTFRCGPRGPQASIIRAGFAAIVDLFKRGDDKWLFLERDTGLASEA
jgi:hypothetical protein